MPQPRHAQIDIDATPYYHCISRCVRRAFLCGEDRRSGQNFDHRKNWLIEKVAELADIFAVGVCAYAALSNHYHLVVRIEGERARGWSDEEVVERYGRLFGRTVEQWKLLPPARAAAWIGRWRARLYDLSWFMRCLNESIARRANEEDRCTGRFWEGRFRSQALLDEAGLLTCMVYVDLNPIRAGMAGSLEESDFTSIQQRLQAHHREQGAEAVAEPPDSNSNRQPALIPFASPAGGKEDRLPLEHDAYVELLVATGAAVRNTEPALPLPEPSLRLLERIGIRSEHWIESVRRYHRHFFSMVGAVHSIDLYCARTDRDHAKGVSWAAQAFRSSA